jgi:hypothetical protein
VERPKALELLSSLRLELVAEAKKYGCTTEFPRPRQQVEALDFAIHQLSLDDQLTTTRLADALDAFWNPACGAIQQASYHGPASGSDIVGAIAQGLAAVAAELRREPR